MKKHHSESHYRSIIKGISWRIIASVTTMTLVYIHTKNLLIALEIGIIETILKLIFYYYHERIWLKIHWGRRYHHK